MKISANMILGLALPVLTTAVLMLGPELSSVGTAIVRSMGHPDPDRVQTDPLDGILSSMGKPDPARSDEDRMESLLSTMGLPDEP